MTTIVAEAAIGPSAPPCKAVAANAPDILHEQTAVGRVIFSRLANRANARPMALRIMDGKAFRQNQHGVVGDAGDRVEFEVRAGKQHIGIARDRAECTTPDCNGLALPRSGGAAFVHDSRRLGRKMKRGLRADADIELEPISRVEAARRRLQIDRQEVGLRYVEIEAARHMQGIADPLAAQRGPAACDIDREMRLDVASQTRLARTRRAGLDARGLDAKEDSG